MYGRIQLLLALPLVACAPVESGDDPSWGPAADTDDGGSTGAGEDPDDPGDDGGGDTTGDSGGSDADDWGESSGGTGGGGDDDPGGSTGGEEPPVEGCEIVPEALGPFYGGVDPAWLDWTPLDFADTGLSQVRQAVAQVPWGTKQISQHVEGARVVAVGEDMNPSGTNRFWVADSENAILVKLAPGARVEVAAGDTVSFDALQVKRVSSEPFISDIAAFSIVGSGSVAVTEAYGELAFIVSGHRLHRVHGEVEGAPYSCGGLEQCQDITYFLNGNAYAGTLRFDTFLFASPLVDGDCVEIQSPLGYHDGERIEVQNTEWMRRY